MTADFAMADRVLVTTQTGDSILESAVREHARVVYRVAYSVLRNPAEAEDTVQDTFLRMLRYGGKAAAIEDMKAWLARVAWRVAVERRSRMTRSAARHEPQSTELAEPSHGADRILIETERKEALNRFIAALPDSLRDPLVLGAIEELSSREVADVLGITEAAVRSRAFRARQILRERMREWMGDER